MVGVLRLGGGPRLCRRPVGARGLLPPNMSETAKGGGCATSRSSSTSIRGRCSRPRSAAPPSATPRSPPIWRRRCSDGSRRTPSRGRRPLLPTVGVDARRQPPDVAAGPAIPAARGSRGRGCGARRGPRGHQSADRAPSRQRTRPRAARCRGPVVRVPCDPGSVAVNGGEMLDLASGGYYPATTHRVVNPIGEAAHLPACRSRCSFTPPTTSSWRTAAPRHRSSPNGSASCAAIAETTVRHRSRLRYGRFHASARPLRPDRPSIHPPDLRRGRARIDDAGTCPRDARDGRGQRHQPHRHRGRIRRSEDRLRLGSPIIAPRCSSLPRPANAMAPTLGPSSNDRSPGWVSTRST